MTFILIVLKATGCRNSKIFLSWLLLKKGWIDGRTNLIEISQLELFILYHDF